MTSATASPAVTSRWEEGLKEYQKFKLADDLGKAYGENTSAPPKGRRAGVLLHPTSLPGAYGVGSIGKEAHAFVDWLASAGMQLWQVLPLVPPEDTYWSPYSGLDALCGNPLMIDLDDLVVRGLLDKKDLPEKMKVADAHFPTVRKVKGPLLVKAARTLLTDERFDAMRAELAAFRKANAWVEESALFYALTQAPDTANMAWWDWPEDLRKRDLKTVQAAREEHREVIELFVAEQFIFDKQWTAVKAYANSQGVNIVGDIPIYVGGQSADVWANQGLFELEASGAPKMVSGVPPDAFSETGQLWGSPLFKWEAHEKEGYKWWAQRLGRVFSMHNETRIDHFRGFAGYWAVKADAKTAMGGAWLKGPGRNLFDALTKQLGEVPIIAEDLGVITADVVALREDIGAPGMAVLQFAWGSGAANPHLPHNHYENCVVYPGTHDNSTCQGWWDEDASKDDKKNLKAYLGMSKVQDVPYKFIEVGMRSVARTTIFTMQDVMRLDNKARMNKPGRAEGNWAWRVGESSVWKKLKKEAAQLKTFAELFDRLPPREQEASSEGASEKP
eukprot:CAMPEP_0206140558 /NCGR_PEP_ID=MMETSP1473-20131121/9760_1 /ASSEMBLY_ACC=CAM_ASM_001109 /TAXON_ID=1461547 /ORGANISM="Stichococcus sp, Strain RCC1054" /LENGTH=558 /DNA_ID=CAMNT_0053534735 /DNA_START=359 /DNA_END=2035 /DNA_ORIENTATION=-